MSTGWRYVLHAGFFGVAGPLIGFTLIFLLFTFNAPALDAGRMLNDPKFWGAMPIAYLIGAVPALITGWTVASGARQGYKLYELYLEGALIGFSSPMIWLLVLSVFMENMTGGVLGILSIIAGVVGVLSALICTRLAWRLRPAAR